MNWSKATDAIILFRFIFLDRQNSEWENVMKEVNQRDLLEIGKACLIRVMSNSWNIIEEELEKQENEKRQKKWITE